MPKLLIFAACEKVLVDQATKSVSLIALLQEVHYKVPPGVSVAQGFSLPMQWAALSLWQEEASDGGIDFEQKIVLEDATGVTLFENVTTWRFTGTNHRIIANVMGLPVSRRLGLNLFYRVAGVLDWILAASYPIELKQDVL